MKNRSWSLRLAALLAVAAVIPACGGSSGGGGVAAVALYLMSAVGGNGSDGYGGDGDWIEFDLYGGGDIKILSSGSVNTSFPVNPNTPYLGTNPLNATTGTMAIGLAEVTTPVNGSVTATPATGLNVPAGVTLPLTGVVTSAKPIAIVPVVAFRGLVPK